MPAPCVLAHLFTHAADEYVPRADLLAPQSVVSPPLSALSACVVHARVAKLFAEHFAGGAPGDAMPDNGGHSNILLWAAAAVAQPAGAGAGDTVVLCEVEDFYADDFAFFGDEAVFAPFGEIVENALVVGVGAACGGTTLPAARALLERAVGELRRDRFADAAAAYVFRNGAFGVIPGLGRRDAEGWLFPASLECARAAIARANEG